MRIQTILFSCLCLCLGSVSACDSGGEGKPDAGAPGGDANMIDAAEKTPDAQPMGVSREEFLAKYPAAICTYMVTCGVIQNVEACPDLAPAFSAIAARIEAGTIEYDGVVGTACFEAFAGECVFDDEVCGSPFAGTVAAGGACYLYLECADESAWCEPADADCQPDTTCCKGVCRAGQDDAPQLDIGEDCSFGECVDEAYCKIVSSSTCKALVAVGGDCSDGSACVDTAFCDWSADYVCVERKTAGGECFGDEQCAPGASCDWSGETPVCKARVEVGGDCSNDTCVETAFCGWSADTSICKPLAAIGDDCSDASCVAAGFCDYSGETATCKARLAEGADCADSSRCDATTFCDPGTSKCVARLPVGGDCPIDIGSACVVGSLCFTVTVSSTCTARQETGAACGDTEECALTDFCKGGEEGGGTCTPRGATGVPCDWDAPCAADLWCNLTEEAAVCAPPGKEGDACVDSWLVGESCESGLWCGPGIDGGSVCRKHGGEGDPCSSWNGECAEGLWCDEGMDLGVCRKPGVVGDPCRPSGWQSCSEGLVCDLAGGGMENAYLCKEPGVVGDSCDPASWDNTCASSLYCSSEGKCTAKALEGEPCQPEVSELCERPDNFCHPTEMKCVKLGGEGAECGDTLPCAAWAACGDEGKCVALPTIGEPCVVNDAFGASCQASDCVDGVCRGEPAPQICTGDAG